MRWDAITKLASWVIEKSGWGRFETGRWILQCVCFSNIQSHICDSPLPKRNKRAIDKRTAVSSGKKKKLICCQIVSQKSLQRNPRLTVSNSSINLFPKLGQYLKSRPISRWLKFVRSGIHSKNVASVLGSHCFGCEYKTRSVRILMFSKIDLATSIRISRWVLLNYMAKNRSILKKKSKYALYFVLFSHQKQVSTPQRAAFL